MFTSVAGRSVVVTGATKGIGKGIASVFARAGANVLITGRNAEDADATVAELDAMGSGRIARHVGDVADRASCEAMAAAAVQQFGGIDVLCANAGIFPDATLAEMTEEDFDRVYATNVKGCMLSVQACIDKTQT